MGLLNQKKRVNLGEGEWVDVRPLSLAALRRLRSEVAGVQASNDEESREEAQGFAMTQKALELCIVAWSDEAPVNAENIGELPYELTFTIAAEIGLGEKERPLATGPSSTDTSEV
jgi:hypothetical protein